MFSSICCAAEFVQFRPWQLPHACMQFMLHLWQMHLQIYWSRLTQHSPVILTGQLQEINFSIGDGHSNHMVRMTRCYPEAVKALKDFLRSTLSALVLQNFDFSEPIDVDDRVKAQKTVFNFGERFSRMLWLAHILRRF